MTAAISHNQAFGRALRRLRLEHHLTQEQLGFDAGMSRNHISRLELGEMSPTLDTLGTFSKTFGISLVELASLIEAQLEEANGHG